MYNWLIVFIIMISYNSSAVNLKSIDSLKQLARMANDTSKVRYMNDVSYSYYKDLNDDSAFTYAKKAIQLQQLFYNPLEYLSSYKIIANLFFVKGANDSVLAISAKGLELANKTNNFEYQFSFLKLIATTLDYTHQTELALSYYLKTRSLAEQHKDTTRVIESISSLGSFYANTNNFDLALRSGREAISLILGRYRKDSASIDYRNLAEIYSNMGSVMARYYTSGLKPIAYIDSSLVYYNKGILFGKKTKNNAVLLILFINISDSYNLKGEYIKAVDVLMQASEIVLNSGNFRLKAVIFLNLGDAYRGLNSINVSIQYLNSAIELTRKNDFKEMAMEAYRSLSKTYEKINNYDEAFINYTKFNNYRDTLSNQELSGIISEKVTKYETDKKEIAIALLTKDSELQQHEIGKQKIVRNIVLSGLFLVILLSGLLLGRYKQIKSLNNDLDKTNSLINNKNRIIMDSIDYAERIQRLILPPVEVLHENFADSFVLYLPKDVIGGDIYWFAKHENVFTLAAVDCTGHGVPGALMSMAAFNLLNASVRATEVPEAASVITGVNKGLPNFVVRDNDRSSVRDGMDLVVCSIDRETLQLNFAGVQNPVYVIRDKQLTELKPEHISIGDPAYADHVFSTQSIVLQKGDWLYLFTDGYADQKGGPQNKKLYYQPFRDLLTEMSGLKGEEQKQRLEDHFREWKGKNEQFDDVLILGIKI
jgi:serine phosphatase RsbU (regulator of sigma subunit)/tetratricopeptide (TPR) repeat protein